MDYNFFGRTDISQQKKLISQYYFTANSVYTELDTRAINASVFGGNAIVVYNLVNNLHYLLVLLLIIQDEMLRDLQNGNMAPWYDRGYYIEKYNIECIREGFDCNGINIQPLLALIGMHSTERIGGIDHMYIEDNPDDSEAEIFIVS